MTLRFDCIYKIEINKQLHCEYIGAYADLHGDDLVVYRFVDKKNNLIYNLSEDDLADCFVEFYMTTEEHILKHPEYYL